MEDKDVAESRWKGKLFIFNLLHTFIFLSCQGRCKDFIITKWKMAIDYFRVLVSGLELACNGGSCGGISLKTHDKMHLKRLLALNSLASYSSSPMLGIQMLLIV